MLNKEYVSYTLASLKDWHRFQDLARVYLMLAEHVKDIIDTSGTGDGGADALSYHNKTIFAFSIEENWKSKLKKDAKKVDEERNNLYLEGIEEFVFVTNQPTGNYRAIEEEHRKNFGWKLKVIGHQTLVDYLMISKELRAVLGIQFNKEDYISIAEDAIKNLRIEIDHNEKVFDSTSDSIKLNLIDGQQTFIRFRIINNSEFKMVLDEITIQNKIPIGLNDPHFSDEPAEGLNPSGVLEWLTWKYHPLTGKKLAPSNYFDVFYSLPPVYPDALRKLYSLEHKLNLTITVPAKELDYKVGAVQRELEKHIRFT
ncbi:hypothetical protein ACQ0QQ_13660 [Lysinibacillus sphaericus]